MKSNKDRQRAGSEAGRKCAAPRRFGRLWALGFLFLAASLLVLAAGEPAEATPELFSMSLVPALIAMGVGVARAGKSFTRREHRFHDVVIVGKNRRTRDYLRGLERYQSTSVRVLGILDAGSREALGSRDHTEEPGPLDSCQRLQEDLGIPDLGQETNLKGVLESHAVGEVIITLPIKSFYDEIAGTLQVCREAGVPVSLSGDLFDGCVGPAVICTRNGAASRLDYSTFRHPRWKLAIKRVVDIVGASLGLLILGIPMILIALAIKLTSRGPVFFKQERVGLNHKRFQMFKFRTMVQDAERLRGELEHLNEQSGPVFKIRRDPRITAVGRLLRKYSLDELPQLFNVLVGDMSLVGPRPPIPAEVKDYEWWQRRRLSAKPGLTCFWQVSGRNDIEFDDWMRLDLKYIDNWSLWLDLRLILRTIPVVVRGEGAS